MDDLNYTALVPEFRGVLATIPPNPGPAATCRNCGHPFRNERDVQLDHVLPPRHRQDWARLHARNLVLVCGTCNRTKSNKAFAAWLDDEERARLTATEQRGAQAPDWWEQLDLGL